MLHRHHVVPRHAGGKDGQVVLLTIEEHAEAHRKLWEEHGRWQDHLAWKALSGHIPFKEINRIKFSEGGKYAYQLSRAAFDEGRKRAQQLNRGKKYPAERVQKTVEGKCGQIVKPYDVEAFCIVAEKNTGKKRSIKTKGRI